MSGTPPWQTDAWDLDGDLAKIRQQWTAVARILEDDVLSERSDQGVSAWNCGEHAGHVLLVARIMADDIEANLAEPGRNLEKQPHQLADRVFTAGGFRRGVATSPRAALPDDHSHAEFLALLPEVIAAWERIGARSDEVRASRARSEHFTLGYLTSSEWVRMCAVHNAHHLKVVRDIAGEAALGHGAAHPI
ncbi:MAG: DinB family protein [Gemmatimonadota bacterium]|jgi:hypothetical protein